MLMYNGGAGAADDDKNAQWYLIGGHIKLGSLFSTLCFPMHWQWERLSFVFCYH